MMLSVKGSSIPFVVIPIMVVLIVCNVGGNVIQFLKKILTCILGHLYVALV
jgi:hypothetical protein